MRTIELVINSEFPSMNEIIAESKKHYAMYAKMKKKYTQLAKVAAEGLPQMGKSDIEFTWYCKNKRKDPDNISAGCKMILDGLVEAEILSNDGWGEVGAIIHLFEIDKRRPRVVVRLREVGTQ